MLTLNWLQWFGTIHLKFYVGLCNVYNYDSVTNIFLPSCIMLQYILFFLSSKSSKYCHTNNTTVCTDPECYNAQRYRQTDRQTTVSCQWADHTVCNTMIGYTNYWPNPEWTSIVLRLMSGVRKCDCTFGFGIIKRFSPNDSNWTCVCYNKSVCDFYSGLNHH